MKLEDLKLAPCPYCKRPAKLSVGKEVSDTSRLHKIECSYLSCVSISTSLSGYSPSYEQAVTNLASDWNVMVEAITNNRTKV